MSDSSIETVAAQLILNEQCARPGDRLGYELVNIGETSLTFGAAYALERESPSGWAPTNARMSFRAWGKRLRAGDRFRLEARIPADAEPGSYRLRKSVRADPALAAIPAGDSGAVEVSATFSVVA